MNLRTSITIGIITYFTSMAVFGQHNAQIHAELNTTKKTIHIDHKLTYVNQSKDSLPDIHLLDWINAFSNKKTPLAKRFSENYRRAFQYSSEQEQGHTQIVKLQLDSRDLSWKRLKDQSDIIKITLPTKPVSYTHLTLPTIA